MRIILLAACLASAGLSASALTFKCEADRPEAVYWLGEEAAVTVTALDASGARATTGVVQVVTDNWGAKRLGARDVDLAKENPFVVRGTLDEPGFLHLKLTEKGKTDGQHWGVAYEPNRIEAGGTCPDDFDAFWTASKADLERTVPLDPRIVRVPEKCRPEFDFYNVSFATFGGKRVWGFLSVPRKATAASPLPALVEVSSAGNGSWTYTMPGGGRGDVVYMFFTAHTFEPPTTDEECRACHAKLAEEYQARYGRGNYVNAGLDRSPRDYHFHRVALGINRAVDWLRAQEYVDKSRLYYQGGSQGGFFGWMLLGLNGHFTAAALAVPAGSDLGGFRKGRTSGWPQPVESYPESLKEKAAASAAYFDGANFAPRITCPIRVSVGFTDWVCPPASVYATFNRLGSADKAIMNGVGLGHFGQTNTDDSRARKWLLKCRGRGADELRVRDPFVVTDEERGVYCLVSSYFAGPGERGGDAFGVKGHGVQFYESRDLLSWSRPYQVLEIPESVDCKALWAPEVHRYRDKWYVFGTVNYRTRDSRGTWTFVSDSLRGPYRPTGTRSITPPEWAALDGTLWVEDGKPYMVFCHEWTQITNGEMCAVAMTDDLSAPIGRPRTLFAATDYTATPSAGRVEDHVTDGPFLYRSPRSGKLFMTWSNVAPGGSYLVILSESASGRLAGPWGNHRVIFRRDGGHGMVFRKLDGTLAFALHQPNRPPDERPRFFDVTDTGDALVIGGE